MSKELKKRIGVYICHCGGNISDVVDVKTVAEEASKHPSVVLGKEFMFMCSDAGQQMIVDDIKEHSLDGLVVASCSPKLHELTFMNVAERAGLNPYEFYHVNIREDASWPHSDDPKGATAKAVRMVNAGIEYVKQTSPLAKIQVNTTKRVLIIGGGIAGIRAAIDLAKMKIDVVLVEKEDRLGGYTPNIYKTYPEGKAGAEIENELVEQLNEFKDHIEIHTSSEISGVSGYIGNFEIQIQNNSLNQQVEKSVGIIIVSTGFKSYTPKDGEYGYNTHDNIITLPDFMNHINNHENTEELFYNGKNIKKIGFIYCVGSRQQNVGGDEPVNEYCSRFCCNATVFLTKELQNRFSNLYSYHFYQDIRTYGKNEAYYLTARENGAIFLKYDPYVPVEVSSDKDISVTIADILTEKQKINVPLDLLVLVTGMEARENKKLEELVKITPGLDRFYKESHPKLKPVETGRMGVLLGGTAQSPRDISETLASASAAAAKAASFVLKGELMLEPAVATVDPSICENHQKCVPECPTNAIEIQNEKAVVNEALCIGCAICTAVCPTEAIQIKTLTTTQIREMIKAMAK